MKKIEKISIRNFRNIKHAEYVIGDKTAICGKNHIGKTNALQAVYWVLTDSMLENTNDFDSIVQHDDNRALTEVTITFEDGTTFGKTYREKWTKTRGSDVESLTGHETAFYLNGVLYKTKTEAMMMLREILFGKEALKASTYTSVSLAKALINPLYLFGQEEWKNARQFIIQLVGEIRDEDIFNAHPEYGTIRADLAQLNGHTDLLAKKYGDAAKSLKAQLIANDSNLDFTNKKIDANKVSDEEVEKARKFLSDSEEYRKSLERGALDVSNPEADAIKATMRTLSAQITEIGNEVAKDDAKLFEDYTIERQAAMNDYQKQANKADELQKQISDIENKAETIKAKADSTRKDIEYNNAKKQRLLDNYNEIKAREFRFTETVCPKCGAVLNQDEEDKARADFDNRKNGELVDCISRGRACATEISRLEAELKAYERQMAESSASALAQLQNEFSSVCQKRDMKRSVLNAIQPKHSPRRDELEELKNKLREAETSLSKAQANSMATRQEKLAAYTASVKEETDKANETIDKETIYRSAKADYENLKCERTIINHNLTTTEEKREILKQFILAKLEMTNAKTKTVFPDIEFVLIEPNIKEGSFNEVCYPLIKGKKTPFINGSNSERILTGIEIINDIVKAMDMEPMMIIFDEGETLDTESIASIRTDSQILTSMVNDNYAVPTAVLIK